MKSRPSNCSVRSQMINDQQKEKLSEGRLSMSNAATWHRRVRKKTLPLDTRGSRGSTGFSCASFSKKCAYTSLFISLARRRAEKTVYCFLCTLRPRFSTWRQRNLSSFNCLCIEWCIKSSTIQIRADEWCRPCALTPRIQNTRAHTSGMHFGRN